MKDLGFSVDSQVLSQNQDQAFIVGAAVCAGLIPNVAKVEIYTKVSALSPGTLTKYNKRSEHLKLATNVSLEGQYR